MIQYTFSLDRKKEIMKNSLCRMKPVLLSISIILLLSSCNVLQGPGQNNTSTTPSQNGQNNTSTTPTQSEETPPPSPTNVDLSTLSKAVSHIPLPADLSKVEAVAKKPISRALYTDLPSWKVPTSYMLSTYLVNGGIHSLMVIFYAEGVAGLKSLGDAPQGKVLDIGGTSDLYNEQFSEYTQKAIWSQNGKKASIKVAFRGKSSGMTYKVNTLIEIEPDPEDMSKCIVHVGIHMDLENQVVYLVADYYERTKHFEEFCDVGAIGGGHGYIISQKNDDGSISLGINNDPWSYFYGYMDPKGSALVEYHYEGNAIPGAEYTNALGEYQDTDEMGGTRIPLYRFEEIPGVTIGYSPEGSGKIWVDNGNGIYDDGEELIPGEVKSIWFKRYYDAGYYYATSEYIPCINLNEINKDDSTHSLKGKFELKSDYAPVDTSYLDSKIESVKSAISLDYDIASYEQRFAQLEAESFPE